MPWIVAGTVIVCASSCLRPGAPPKSKAESADKGPAPVVDRASARLERSASGDVLIARFSTDRDAACRVIARPDDRASGDVKGECQTSGKRFVVSVSGVRPGAFYRARVEAWHPGEAAGERTVMYVGEGVAAGVTTLGEADFESAAPTVSVGAMYVARVDSARLVVEVQRRRLTESVAIASTSGVPYEMESSWANDPVTLDGALVGRGAPTGGSPGRAFLPFQVGANGGGIRWGVSEGGKVVTFETGAPSSVVSLASVPASPVGWTGAMEWPVDAASLAGERRVSLTWKVNGDPTDVRVVARVTDVMGRSRVETVMNAADERGEIDMGALIDSADEGWIISVDAVTRQTRVIPGSGVPPWVIEWHNARVARFQR